MELIEPVDVLNKRLRDIYGIDVVNGMPMWRIVFSEDQLEKRLTPFTDAGIELLYPEVRLLPKYNQWVKEKWILENLVLVPESNKDELADSKISYECLYVFEDDKGNYLPPKWEACEFVIACVEAAKGKPGNLRHYIEDVDDPEVRHKRINKIEEELFGDVSSLGYRTVTGEAVAGFYSKIDGIISESEKK